MNVVKALLVGKRLAAWSALSRRLQAGGARCEYAASFVEARSLLEGQTFDLVVSNLRLAESSALELIPLVENRPSSLFCIVATESGSWWLPLVRAGKLSADEPAVRAPGFARMLDGLLGAARVEESVETE